jgi:protein-disulfide isomerase
MTISTLFTRRTALSLIGAAGVAAALPGGARANTLLMGEQMQGDPDAPVTVIEYISLTCPHCARFHETAYQQLKTNYLDTGKAHLILREVYFDRLGLWGAMVARCDGGSRYWGFIDHMLRTQSEWTKGDDVMGHFKKIGRIGGLSDAQVEACLNDQEGAKALVEQYQQYRDDPRLTGTPTLIVAEERVENPTYERLAAAIDAQL